MRKKLVLLTLALAATAAASLATLPAPAEAACKRICCPGGPCWECCTSSCFNPVCPP